MRSRVMTEGVPHPSAQLRVDTAPELWMGTCSRERTQPPATSTATSHRGAHFVDELWREGMCATSGTKACSMPCLSCWPGWGEQTFGTGESHIKGDRTVFSAFDRPPLGCWVKEKRLLSGFGGREGGRISTQEAEPTLDFTAERGLTYEMRYFQHERRGWGSWLNLQKLLIEWYQNDPPWKILLQLLTSRHTNGAGTVGCRGLRPHSNCTWVQEGTCQQRTPSGQKHDSSWFRTYKFCESSCHLGKAHHIPQGGLGNTFNCFSCF